MDNPVRSGGPDVSKKTISLGVSLGDPPGAVRYSGSFVQTLRAATLLAPFIGFRTNS